MLASNRRVVLGYAIAAAFPGALAAPALAEPVLGLTTDNRLITFDSATPGVATVLGAVTGLGAGENLLGIDVRPVTGAVYAVGSSNRVYSINLNTRVATAAGGAFNPALPASEIGIDFNPTVDRIRVVGAGGENRRLNPNDGQAVSPATDTALAFATGGSVRAVGVAYTNSQPGGVPAGTTRQFIIDSALDILGETGSQAGGNASFNGGVVTSVGALGFDTTDLVGFDISGPSGLALASLTSAASRFSSLYSINLQTGAATLVGGIGGASPFTLRDITILPAPSAAGLLALASVAAARRRR